MTPPQLAQGRVTATVSSSSASVLIDRVMSIGATISSASSAGPVDVGARGRPHASQNASSAETSAPQCGQARLPSACLMATGGGVSGPAAGVADCVRWSVIVGSSEGPSSHGVGFVDQLIATSLVGLDTCQLAISSLQSVAQGVLLGLVGADSDTGFGAVLADRGDGPFQNLSC